VRIPRCPFPVAQSKQGDCLVRDEADFDVHRYHEAGRRRCDRLAKADETMHERETVRQAAGEQPLYAEQGARGRLEVVPGGDRGAHAGSRLAERLIRRMAHNEPRPQGAVSTDFSADSQGS